MFVDRRYWIAGLTHFIVGWAKRNRKPYYGFFMNSYLHAVPKNNLGATELQDFVFTWMAGGQPYDYLSREIGGKLNGKESKD